MNTTIPLMLILRVCQMVTGHWDGHWAGNLIIRATPDQLNSEIHIISSAHKTPTITFRLITDNLTQTIFLGHLAHLHYVSPRSLSESQVMRYGECIKDGVRLIKTYTVNIVLTWLFLTISSFQEIYELLDNIQHKKHKANTRLIPFFSTRKCC